MDQIPLAQDSGIPGGLPEPWLVARPGSLLRAFSLPSRSGALKSVHVLWVLAIVAVYAPLHMLNRLGGPLAAGAYVAAVALVAAYVAVSIRTTRLEWDGQKVVWHTALQNKTIATAGTGQIVRAKLSGAMLNGYSQMWLDQKGRAVGRFSEAQWDPAVLEQIAAQARIPVVDIGEVTPQELAKRYPKLMPGFSSMVAGSSSDGQGRGLGSPGLNVNTLLVIAIALVMVAAVTLHNRP
jgi:hypothetical protein